MNSDRARYLYAVEPDGQRFIQWLHEFTRLAARVYWDLTVTLPVAIVSMTLAFASCIVSLMDLSRKSRNVHADLIALAISIPCLVSHRFRVFFWTWCICQVGWLLLVLSVILPFTGPNFQVTTIVARTLVTLVYFAPPPFLAFYVRRLFAAGDPEPLPSARRTNGKP